MGNTPSTEATRKSLPSRPTFQPQPPLPIAITSASPSCPNKLSKPRTRRRSTISRARTSDDLASSVGSNHARFTTSGPGLVSAFSTSQPPPSLQLDGFRPPHHLVLPASPPAIGSSAFAYEQPVAPAISRRASGYWQAMPSVYSTPDAELDVAFFQEYQQQQQDLQLQQWKHHFDPQHSEQSYPDDEEQFSRNPRLKPKSRKRSSLFRSRSSRRPAEPQDEQNFRRRNSISQENPSTGDWHHTWDGGPMTYEQALSQYYGGRIPDSWPLPVNPRASWNYDLSSYEAKRLLHIVDGDLSFDHGLEQTTVASESREPVVSEVTWKSSHPVQDGSRGLSRANSDISMYAPVRRRSIVQVPGVATRRSSSSSIFAGGVTMTQQRFRHSVSTTPSLSHQTSFESTAHRVLSMPPMSALPAIPILFRLPGSNDDTEPTPRVTTPCDKDYQAIGAFKLGSLRITNGTASPVPSLERPRTREVDTNKEKPISRALTFDKKPSKSQIRPDNGKNDLQPFPPYAEQSSEPLAEIDTRPFSGYTISKNIPGSDLPQIALSDEVFSGFVFDLYPLDDDPSPLRLQTTSKNTAMEDDLFESESDTPEYLPDEILDVRLDLNAKSAGSSGYATAVLADGKTAQGAHIVSRSDSGFVLSPAKKAANKPLCKADSGYSSNMSMRSFKQAASNFMSPRRDSFYIAEPKLPDLNADACPSDAQAPNANHVTLTVPNFIVSPSPSRSFPSVLSNDTPLVSPASTADANPSSTGATIALPAISHSTGTMAAELGSPVFHNTRLTGPQLGLSKKRHNTPTSLEVLRSPVRANSYPTLGTSPFPITPLSAKSGGSKSASSSVSGTQRSSKLRRLFNRGAAAYKGAQTGADAPSVSQDMQTKLSDPADLSPLAARRVAMKRKVSKDTLKTILSVGSLEACSALEVQANGPVGSMPPTTSKLPGVTGENRDQSRRRPLGRRHTFQNVPSSLAHAAASVMSPRKAAHRKSALEGTVLEPIENTGSAERSRKSREHGRGTKARQTEKLREKTSRGFQKPTEMPSLIKAFGAEASLADRNTPNRRANGSSATSTAMSEAQHDPLATPSSLRSRTMSLTAQLERNFNMKLPFSRSSRPTTADAEEEKQQTSAKLPVTISNPILSSSAPESSVRASARLVQAEHGYSNGPRREGQSARVHGRCKSKFSAHNLTSLDHKASSSSHPRMAAQPLSPYSLNATSPYELRHRASCDDYSNVPTSNGRWRSGSDGTDDNRFQQQQNHQQKAWDHYYRQHGSQLPPSSPRGYHYRNQSTGSRGGTQAPYRILHSYNSPAYRNAPIWG
ncbi:proteophosphoglycan ppg4 [Grosmannia clavigera kw1407]|uniref:Proteophosphoglycan ppg4 n=1 Tax=Grosmannia clavigera (strain kw1407 / UAMH 11150) TaxID=655863 RepID=F0XK33_GROCL|nr:proteophosphoglycan ppg4 [Grosmannia clavigera kw1407]EFX01870.1 proteophosphoglycan ppg4 [Grosmannia clavigera kw1407]